MLSSNEIRKLFIDFFEKKGHTICPSASLIPINDPSLLFTSAGMVPFKDMFLGKVPLDYTKAVSIQKCVRTTDIDNVGHTARHLTFFEMMGNFSFGDYFKEEAITWAWEFFTEVLELDKDKLYVTIYKDDKESLNIWSKLIDSKRVYKLGEDTNYWSIGETGPCGPCSEILYDMGKELGCGKKSCKPGCDCDRYLEVWNLVFTQFDKQKDGSLKPLPQKNIDTGMGFERLASVVQGVHSPYETDTFKEISEFINKLGKKGNKNYKDDITTLRIISDHARTATFLLADGVFPSNEGRGYVLKRLIRRAVRQGHKIGLKSFLYKVSDKVIDIMKEAYPELIDKRDYCKDILISEEEKFEETLEHGLKLLDELKVKYNKKKIFPGEEVFKLFDTFGMPLDIVKDVADEEGYKVDEQGFEQCMEKQRARAKKNTEGWEDMDDVYNEVIKKCGQTEFVGYDELEVFSSVTALLDDTGMISKADKSKGNIGIVLKSTSFYGESGGQRGDEGELIIQDKKGKILGEVKINLAKKPITGLIIHYGYLENGEIKVGDKIVAKINKNIRDAIKKNHTATHLLQSALRKYLGKHVEQSGSEVSDDGFRFDFTHPKGLSKQELVLIEHQVNAWIQNNFEISKKEMGIADAKKEGALAFFGEKYGKRVRVCKIQGNDKESISTELCGGTHCDRTGDIGLFKIISESSIAGGIRRIEAITGMKALSFMNGELERLNKELEDTKKMSVKKIKEFEKCVNDLERKEKLKSSDDIIEKADEEDGIKIILQVLDKESNINEIRILADAINDKLTVKKKEGVILILDPAYKLICKITQGLVKSKKIDAKQILKQITSKYGGGGGGRPDMVQAGLKTIAPTQEIIKYAEGIIKKGIGN